MIPRQEHSSTKHGTMKNRLGMFFLTLAVSGWFAATAGDAVIPHRQDQPPNKPYSPQEALSRMRRKLTAQSIRCPA